jgi:hypothetical protein
MFTQKLSPEILSAGNEFISRIKNGVLRKEILPNTAPVYPNEKASESFVTFLKSDQFKSIVGE